MTQNILTQRQERKESASFSQTSAKKNDYLTLPTPTQQFSFPIVKISDLVDQSQNKSTSFRKCNIFAAMPQLKENSNADSELLLAKTSTTKKFLASDHSDSPFYFPVLESNYKNVPGQGSRIHRNPQNLSKSVQVTNNYKLSIGNEDSLDVIMKKSFDSSIGQVESRPPSPQDQNKTLFSSIQQKPQEQTNQILKYLIKPQKQVHTMPQSVMSGLKTLAIRSCKKRFKIMLIFVQAAVRMSQQYRRKKRAFQEFAQMKQIHQGFMDKYKIESIKGQQKQYVKMIFKKLITYTSEKKYLLECEKIWDKDGQLEKDIRSIRFCALSLMFMQNLELLTRKIHTPEILKHSLKAGLFESQERRISQFVAKRCTFLSEEPVQISIQKKLLLVSEYYLFDIVGSYLIEILNEIKHFQVSHKNQTLYYYISILNLMQILFTKYFSNVQTLKFRKIKPIQRKLLINEDMQLQIEFGTELDEDETQIFQGFFHKNQVEVILEEKQGWSEKMTKLFQQAIMNLQQQIVA